MFPLTARALAFRGGNAFRAMIERGLAGTDARIVEGKPVTPAFLFAILLWGPLRAQVEREIAKGVEMSLAWQRVSHQVMAEQTRHVAIPRRFSVTMHEIWLLQPRFELLQKKRVFRLLAHPRFRAAYDFLLLRADESPELAQLGAWWTHAQTVSHDVLSAQLNAAPTQASAVESVALPDVADAPKKRPRRRRRRPDAPAGEPVE